MARRSRLVGGAVVVATVLRLASAADVHVAVGGHDAADGTAGRPVASLRRAFDLVRERRMSTPDHAGPVVIEVGPGRHELADTLVLTPEDSGTERSPTVVRAAQGAAAVISGGRVIHAWEPADDGSGRWMARLPSVPLGEWCFAQLFVDGQRRYRPVLPATGWHLVADSVEPTAASRGKGHDRFSFAGEDLRTDWINMNDVEVVAVHRWTMSRMRIAGIGPLAAASGAPAGAGNAVAFTGRTPAEEAWFAFAKGGRFLVENVREALGEPGSWYLDRMDGILLYCPRDGEVPGTTEVIAPRLDRLLVLAGDAAAGRFVDHVRFEGLSFAHGNWTAGAEGQSFPQAEVNVGGAIAATAARHVTFADCSVRHVGRYAVEFGAGCSDCAIERCDLADLGGGGVLIGTSGGLGTWGSVAPPQASVERIAVRDCAIRHGGRMHPAAVGVWIGHASHCVVEHCDIHDLTYTGVSVGWTWGYGPSLAHHNHVRCNRIHHLGHGVLSDMGGVYTLGVSPGTVVEGNVIHDVSSHHYGGWGLYADEGSTGIVMRRNLVFRTASGGFHQHYGRDNLIENNLFAAARDWQLQRTKVEDHTGFTFARNVVWWDSAAPLLQGDWSKGVDLRDNCYWNASGAVRFPGGSDLASWQEAGHDAGSIVADPKLADPAHDDYTLVADSPVRALGFEPLDPSRAGPRTPPPTDGLPPVPTIWLR